MAPASSGPSENLRLDLDEPAGNARPASRSPLLRLLEAILFASTEPLDEGMLASRLPAGADLPRLLAELAADYEPRGINLRRLAGKWAFRTAPDLGFLLARGTPELRKLSRAALETLAITAYHQPVTRAEIEDIRGVSANKGTLDVLLEAGWLRLRGRRRSPGRPVTYGTTDAFLIHFGLDSVQDLPGLEELKGSGLIDPRVPASLSVPLPSDDPGLRDDEDPLEEGALDDEPLGPGDDIAERDDLDGEDSGEDEFDPDDLGIDDLDDDDSRR